MAMMKLACQLLKALWRAILAASGAIGVLYAWPDIRDFPETYGFTWGQIMPERETVLFVMLCVAFAWIVWMDARPVIKRWRESARRHPISVCPGVYCDSRPIKDGAIDGSALYSNSFYLEIRNGYGDGRALRRVQCQLFGMFEFTSLLIRGSSNIDADIRDGEFLLFEIGRIHSLSKLGNIYLPQIEIGEGQLITDTYDVKNGTKTFSVHGHNGRVYAIGSNPEVPHVWKMRAVISADEVVARTVMIHIDFENEERPVSWVEQVD